MERKAAFIIGFLAIALAGQQYASAAAIDFYSIDISAKDSIPTKLTITFDSKIEAFSIPLGRLQRPPRIVSATANKGSIECRTAVNDAGKTTLSCKIANAPDSRNTVVLELESANFIEAAGDKNTLTTVYESLFETKSLSASFTLPERAALSEEPPQNSISPRNGEIKTDGKKIFIFWNKQNITAGDIITFSASYTLPEQRESPINTLLIIPIISILAVLVWFVIRSRQKSRHASESAAVSVLSKDEKVLFDILKARGGSANQKMLVKESNFSKAKVSRLLKDLKERGVIEIQPISGRENKILLNLGKPKEGNKQEQPTQQPQQQDRPKQ